MSVRVRLARWLLPRWYVVIWREDLEEAQELADTAYGRVPASMTWARVSSCLHRAEERCA